ncbi:MAG: phage terminase large subunit [Alphaproteobacteria bacterium]|nr:phage terminase large subunit [Alphaproteobacteria bacterium]
MEEEPQAARAAYHRLLRQDFASFIAKAFATICPGTGFVPGWHIELLAEYLEAARKGQITRLIVNLPPRSLKSVCVSVAWPAWILGHDPAARILAASYSANLALKHSLDCRQIVQSEWYRQVFPATRLSREQNEKHKFMTTRFGFRLATSVGGTLTGEGGGFLLMDDPLNPAQAASTVERERANAWFDHTFASRLDDKRTGVMVLVMQRLHAADLTAHLMEKGGWDCVRLPAIAPEAAIHDFGRVCVLREAGEPLHAAREDVMLLERARKELGSHAFAAQYQQEPVPRDGGLFKPWWLMRFDAPPASATIVQSWDTAIKSGEQHDASCCLTFAESQGGCYLLDALTLRAEYPQLKRAVLAQAERFAPQAILIEDKASGQQLLQDLRCETPLPLIAVLPRGDKFTRAAAASAQVEAGRLKLPKAALWLAEFEHELLAFPNGAHDDQVDALSQYFEWTRGRATGFPALRQI